MRYRLPFSAGCARRDDEAIYNLDRFSHPIAQNGNPFPGKEILF